MSEENERGGFRRRSGFKSGGYEKRGFKPRGAENGFRPLEVVVTDGDVERAIRTLKREVGKEGVLKALKRKRYYEKPSEAKKRKQREALRRRRRAERRTKR